MVHPPVNLFTLRSIQASQVEHERMVLHTQIKDYISQPLGYGSTTVSIQNREHVRHINIVSPCVNITHASHVFS